MPGIDLELDHTDASMLSALLKVWQDKRQRNAIRTVYFDGKAALKDFGISLPPSMRSIEAALGWTAKGVHAVTDRSKFEGFVDSTGSDDPFGLEQIMWDNRFRVEFPAAEVSSAVHGCSFLSVSHGDVQSGEADVLVLARSAESSAAIWDRRRRTLAGFLSIVALDESKNPSEIIMYTPDKVITLTKTGTRWIVDVRRNPLRRVSVAPLVHKFELGRPLGHSRITRASMYFTDAALRTIVRGEVSSEFYSAVEYWLFGADVSDFVGDDRWTAVMGRIKAMDTDSNESADKPDLHRFNGASPEPHISQMRMWANLFADDQDLDVKFADTSNPSSADAIFAAKETLITTTRDANELWGHGAVESAQMAVMLRDGLDVVPGEMRALRAQFTDPAIVSPTARADAYSKLSAADADFATSRVGRQYAGLSLEQITQLEAEQKRKSASDRIAQLVEAARGARQAVASQPASQPASQ
ncbi:MAG TPA: phage portal protein [Microbacterium sp.]|nr:phage portal protein [Microbacterium sp.]